jgi:hypothetical protein
MDSTATFSTLSGSKAKSPNIIPSELLAEVKTRIISSVSVSSSIHDETNSSMYFFFGSN